MTLDKWKYRKDYYYREYNYYLYVCSHQHEKSDEVQKERYYNIYQQMVDYENKILEKALTNVSFEDIISTQN